jgi:hypothetical protein
VNRSHRTEAGGVTTLASVAALRAVARKVIKELRPTPPQHNRHEAGPAVVGHPNPDPHPLMAAAMMHHTHPVASVGETYQRRGVAGLPHTHTPIALAAARGDTLPPWIGSVQQQIAGRPIRMLAYNGSIPGPLLRVAQAVTSPSR